MTRTLPAILASDGWIEWSGGECPVDGETLVNVKTRLEGMGASPTYLWPANAIRWRWSPSGSLAGDIIAYRVVS